MQVPPNLNEQASPAFLPTPRHSLGMNAFSRRAFVMPEKPVIEDVYHVARLDM